MVKISGAVKDIYRITYFYELVLKKTFDIFEKVWYSIKVVRNKHISFMREWLSGGAPPCQGGGRGFDPRLAL